MLEQTLVLIKPDAVKMNLISAIMERFWKEEFRLVAARYANPTAKLIEAHYQKKFVECPELHAPVIEYFKSGRLIAIILAREDAVARARTLVGPVTNAPAGTIRGDFRKDQGDALYTLVHASDSFEAAKYEISVWFPPPPVVHSAENEKKYGMSRRAFCFGILGVGALAAVNKLFAAKEVDMSVNKEERERLFSEAIAQQRNGNFTEAERYARQCLAALKDVQSMEDSAMSRVSLTVESQCVLLPDYLHTETALAHFRAAGIKV